MSPRVLVQAPTSADRWRLADRAVQAQDASRHGLGALSGDTGIATTTLRRWARVARQFSADSRTRWPDLSFSHFEAVARSEDRHALLTLASNEGWSAAELRREVRSREALANQHHEVASSGCPSRGPATLEAALEYVEQLGSLNPGLRTSLRGGVREKVRELAAAAAELDGGWE